MVHFMRNVLSKTPPSHRDWASAALRAVFAMESRETALAKAEQVAAEMEGGRLKAAADCLRGGGRRDDHVPAAGVPGRAPQEDTHQQHDRTAQPGDPAAHARRGQLPGRQQRPHARLREDQARHSERMERTPLSRHVPAR